MATKYIQLVISLIAIGLLTSCATPEPIVIREPVEIRIPVPVNPVFPAALIVPYKPQKLPTFISPDDPTASAALSEQGLIELRILLRDLVTRDAAWQAVVKEYNQ